MLKFEVKLSRADINRIKDVLGDTIKGDESDEDIIRELFYVQSYMSEEDLRNAVEVRKLLSKVRRATDG